MMLLKREKNQADLVIKNKDKCKTPSGPSKYFNFGVIGEVNQYHMLGCLSETFFLYLCLPFQSRLVAGLNQLVSK